MVTAVGFIARPGWPARPPFPPCPSAGFSRLAFLLGYLTLLPPSGYQGFLLHLAGQPFFNKDLLARPGVTLGVIHQTAISGWGGRKDLHLFGHYAKFIRAEFLQGDHFRIARAGVCRDHVIGEELFLAFLLRNLVKALFKLQRALDARLAHPPQYSRIHMLRRKFQLPRDVVANEFAHVFFTKISIRADQIRPQAR